MEKYKKLIGKNMDVVYNKDVLYSQKITTISIIDETLEGRGKLYKCSMEYDRSILNSSPTLDFDEQTLNELLEKNISICPSMQNLFYIIKKEESDAQNTDTNP